MDSQGATNDEAWFLKSKFPVFWPASEALTLPEDEFQSYLARFKEEKIGHESSGGLGDASTSAAAPPTDDDPDGLVKLRLDSLEPSKSRTAESEHPFMQGLLSHGELKKNLMLTENSDVAYRSTNEPLLDLFIELEDVVQSDRLLELLNAAWNDDPLATLKIIFNARSIHLGKGSRGTFYRCAGWLAEHHPLTLAANLRWLSRPLIEKKVKKDEELEGGMVLVTPEKDDDDVTRFDIKHGVAHGYWKDLLNILALSANDRLSVLADMDEVLKVKRQPAGEKHDPVEAKEHRAQVKGSRHDAAIAAWERLPVHRALHMTVARLFAEQLQADLARLRGADAKAKAQISLCAKWAPSQARFHDKHTFVASSIAEIMYPESSITTIELPKTGDAKADREVYLRYAREAYRKDISALREYLNVVERDLTAKSYSNIKYNRVPSVAMKNYKTLFATKDTDGFEAYLEKVAEGSSSISGATLLPSTLVMESAPRHGTRDPRLAQIKTKVIDGQWRSLVQRVRDSGTIDSCIAVCDVSGSMTAPVFPDGTTPMDSAIGLSLLVAEVTEPPFGGAFITFSDNPEVQSVNITDTLTEKVRDMKSASWGMSTNFVAVFEDLILPMAMKNGLTQDQMVKRVIVFSDMQFNSAMSGGENKWSSSFERIQAKYRAAGYDMPQLVFWNLAGGRAGYGLPGFPAGGRGGLHVRGRGAFRARGRGRGGYFVGGHGDPVAPKPVVSTQDGTAIVSGYSQGMLKVFMEKGLYDDYEEEEEEEEDKIEVADGDDDDEFAIVSTSKKQKMDPLRVVEKAIGHKAYSMLKVVD
jgi:hypothetical protein